MASILVVGAAVLSICSVEPAVATMSTSSSTISARSALADGFAASLEKAKVLLADAWADTQISSAKPLFDKHLKACLWNSSDVTCGEANFAEQMAVLANIDSSASKPLGSSESQIPSTSVVKDALDQSAAVGSMMTAELPVEHIPSSNDAERLEWHMTENHAVGLSLLLQNSCITTGPRRCWHKPAYALRASDVDSSSIPRELRPISITFKEPHGARMATKHLADVIDDVVMPTTPLITSLKPFLLHAERS